MGRTSYPCAPKDIFHWTWLFIWTLTLLICIYSSLVLQLKLSWDTVLVPATGQNWWRFSHITNSGRSDLLTYLFDSQQNIFGVTKIWMSLIRDHRRSSQITYYHHPATIIMTIILFGSWLSFIPSSFTWSVYWLSPQVNYFYLYERLTDKKPLLSCVPIRFDIDASHIYNCLSFNIVPKSNENIYTNTGLWSVSSFYKPTTFKINISRNISERNLSSHWSQILKVIY